MLLTSESECIYIYIDQSLDVPVYLLSSLVSLFHKELESRVEALYDETKASWGCQGNFLLKLICVVLCQRLVEQNQEQQGMRPAECSPQRQSILFDIFPKSISDAWVLV